MTQAVTQILEKVQQLSADERADLIDRMVESFPYEDEAEIVESQISEVRRRIADVESGKVKLIPSEEVFAEAAAIVAAARAKGK